MLLIQIKDCVDFVKTLNAEGTGNKQYKNRPCAVFPVAAQDNLTACFRLRKHGIII